MSIAARTRHAASRRRGGRTTRATGPAGDDPLQAVRRVRAGFHYQVLIRFQETSGLSWKEISGFVGIPQRTMTRRQQQGKLQPDESDRVLRATRIFDLAVELFEGDVPAARKWLGTNQSALGGETPLEFASTEVGARVVESLMGRLAHGVFA
jgi:putative toxin-antitoxin system antitoxin component (TIGR02293 family)